MGSIAQEQICHDTISTEHDQAGDCFIGHAMKSISHLGERGENISEKYASHAIG